MLGKNFLKWFKIVSVFTVCLCLCEDKKSELKAVKPEKGPGENIAFYLPVSLSFFTNTHILKFKARTSDGFYYRVLLVTGTDTIQFAGFPSKKELNELFRISDQEFNKSKCTSFISDLAMLYPHLDFVSCQAHDTSGRISLEMSYQLKDIHNTGELNGTMHKLHILFTSPTIVDTVIRGIK